MPKRRFQRLGEERITEETLAALINEALERDQQQELRDKEVDEVAFDTWTWPIMDEHVKRNMEFVKTRLAHTYLALAAGSFMRENPHIEVVPLDETQQEKERADRLSVFVNKGIWEAYRHGHENSWLLQIQDVLRYGRGIQKWHLNWNNWFDDPHPPDNGALKAWVAENREFIQRAPLPISARHVHPRLYHSFPDDSGLQQAFEIQPRTVRSILSSYSDVEGIDTLRKRNMKDVVWWIEHQNRKWLTYALIPNYSLLTNLTELESVDNTFSLSSVAASGLIILDQYEHGYGEPSFIEIDGARQTALAPSLQRLSILWGGLPELKQTDRTMSQIATNIKTRGWFFPYFTLGADSPKDIDATTGRPKSFPMRSFYWEAFLEGEKPAAFEPPEMSGDVYRYLELLRRDIEMHFQLALLSGNVADYTPGYSYNLRQHAMRNLYNQIATNLRDGFSQIARVFLAIAGSVGEELSVVEMTKEGRRGGYTRIRPEDLKPRILLETRFPLTLPTDRQLMLRLAKEATAEPNPLMSTYEVLNDILEVEDPQRTQRLLMEEQIDRAVMPVLTQLVLQEYMTAVAQETGTEERTGAPVGQPPGNVVMPGVGEPLSPTPATRPRRPARGGRTAGSAAAPPREPIVTSGGP